MPTNLNILTDLQPKTNDAKALVPVLVTLFKSFEENIERMFEKRFDDLKQEFLSEVRERDTKIVNLEDQVVQLKDRIGNLEERIETNDQYERRDALVFTGSSIPPPSNHENCSLIIQKLLKDNLNIEIQPNEISVAHRLGNKGDSQQAHKRSLIVKFCRRSSKVDVISSARRKKVDNFYVNESLTPISQTISYVLRKAKREHPEKISGSTTFDGRNFVWVNPPNPTARGAKAVRHSITTYERLANFCTRVLEQPVTHFINEWPH